MPKPEFSGSIGQPRLHLSSSTLLLLICAAIIDAMPYPSNGIDTNGTDPTPSRNVESRDSIEKTLGMGSPDMGQKIWAMLGIIALILVVAVGCWLKYVWWKRRTEKEKQQAESILRDEKPWNAADQAFGSRFTTSRMWRKNESKSKNGKSGGSLFGLLDGSTWSKRKLIRKAMAAKF
ncbi:hypothetical protein BJ508DRAFT_359966 [Ascobolus immersus RN42]|uniref:Uncharacterized protein n=1 Tax=Ascobolus immersus RN42 TaxID=1160509 RepID=A0A3N4IGW9_ASCIM|nr:hypothetical protein BJ508DRAFT_359966 [Ascobolus immersus RN42]